MSKKTAPRGMPLDRIEIAANAPQVLVVEDDPDAATVAQGMLNLLGYRSVVAPDAHEALHILHASRPALILLDVNLPTMDGLSLLRIARKLKGVADVPVVAASAYHGSEGPISRTLRHEGVHSFLDKPFTLNGLRQAIDGALGAHLAAGRASRDGSGFILPGRREAKETHEVDRQSLANIPIVEESDLATITGSIPSVPTPLPIKESGPPRAREPAPTPPPQNIAPPSPAPLPPPPPQPPSRRPTPASLRARGTAATISRTGLRAVTGDSFDSVDGPRPERSVVREVAGTATDSDGGWPVLLERCSTKTARFTGQRPFNPGEQLRLQFTFRVPVNYAMTDLTVRMLARTTASVPKPGGRVATEVALLGMGPQEAFARLLQLLGDG